MHETSSTFIALAAGLAFIATPARAEAEAECRGVHVIASSDLSEVWASAANDLKAQIPAAADDQCASMTLSIEPADGGAARLSATSRDGRHADRIVQKPSALGSTALGLVASLPPDEPPAPAAPPKPIAPNPVNSASSSTPSVSSPTTRPTQGEASVAPPPGPEVWLGGGLGGRIAEPSAVGMLDLEARGALEVKHWSLIVSLRYGSSIGETLTPADAAYEETVVGLGIGRILPVGQTALEVAIIPSFAAVNIDDDDDSNGSNGSRTQVRISASVRWSIPLDKWWRFTITADSDFSPRSFAHEVHLDPDLPPLPAWTGGLRFGASGKLL